MGSTTEDALPVFDLAPFLACAESDVAHDVLDACKRLATCLVETGCLIVRDPRVSEDENERFISLMEQYFGRPNEAKLAEARPDVHYQARRSRCRPGPARPATSH
jgi:hypothetical protein